MVVNDDMRHVFITTLLNRVPAETDQLSTTSRLEYHRRMQSITKGCNVPLADAEYHQGCNVPPADAEYLQRMQWADMQDAEATCTTILCNGMSL